MKKRIKVITANNAGLFEQKANQALARIESPRLIFDKTTPYLLYIVQDTETNGEKAKEK